MNIFIATAIAKWPVDVDVVVLPIEPRNIGSGIDQSLYQCADLSQTCQTRRSDMLAAFEHTGNSVDAGACHSAMSTSRMRRSPPRPQTATLLL